MSKHAKAEEREVPLATPSTERVFLADDVIPDAAEAFLYKVPPIDEAIKIADIVLDTNVLLLPYGAGSSSLNDIVCKFKDLAKEGRLFLPAQVAREFIKNRPNKLAELQQQLADKISKFQAIEKLNFPVLEGVKDYDQLNEVLSKTTEIKKELTTANTKLLKLVRSWEWNDPVGTAYREVFTADTVVQPKYERDDVLKELKRRQSLQMPPGYKDGGKDDLGVGDFLIWLTILHIGSANKKPAVFVSGDEKADWQHRSSSGAFLPRFELLDEYRRASGEAFYIIPFSKLLELLNAGAELIEEIKQEEQRVQEAHNCTAQCPYCATPVPFRLAEPIGSTSQPRCSSCEKRFYAHRTRDGLVCRQFPEKTQLEDLWKSLKRLSYPHESLTHVGFSCPNCGESNETQLGLSPFSTQWCQCKRCTGDVVVHRLADGDFGVLRPVNLKDSPASDGS